MRLLVDTNRYADLISPDWSALEILQNATEVWLSLITVGELLAGFATGSQREANEKRLDQFLNVQGVGVLLPDHETARYYAEVNSILRSRGKPILTNDMWIAAQALQHDLILDTRDEHFRHVSNLRLTR